MAEKSDFDRKMECIKLAHAIAPQALSDRVLIVAKNIYEWIMSGSAQSAGDPTRADPTPGDHKSSDRTLDSRRGRDRRPGNPLATATANPRTASVSGLPVQPRHMGRRAG